LVSPEELPTDQAVWLASAIGQSDQILHAGDLYRETYRPQLHFTSKRGWNNDPNGLVVDHGEWHLFYQHNPFGIRWGNMHWGHAVSRDLAHWTELPEALFQNSLRDMAFSGGGLVDENNTAGWQSGPNTPLVVAFTSTGRGECLAYSQDYGRSLTEYPGNPVIRHQGRDPKILWFEPGRHWVMVVYEELAANPAEPEYGYAFYTSTDLKQWSRQSFLPGWYECPELCELSVEGQSEVKKWVLYGCVRHRFASAFQIGQFDGKTFTPEMSPVLAHAGPCFYAAQIFNQAPDQRRVMIGWLKGANYPGMPFSQGMSVPLELSLRSNPNPDEPYRLCFWPAAELATLRTAQTHREGLDAAGLNDLLAGVPLGELWDLSLEVEADGPFQLHLGDDTLAWDPTRSEIQFAEQSARLAEVGPRLSLRLLLDRCVTEVFVQEGRLAFAAATLFRGGTPKAEGAIRSASVSLYRLKSIWE
jgi:fructan beta-fructosidase